MADTLSDYLKKKKMFDQMKIEIQRMEESKGLKKEFEFRQKLESLMDEFDKSAKDVLAVLSVIDGSIDATGNKSSTRKQRAVKVFKNPHTGEVVETRGGNQKTLNAWRKQYGPSAVESWLQ